MLTLRIILKVATYYNTANVDEQDYKQLLYVEHLQF